MKAAELGSRVAGVRIHFALRERGSSFSAIARSVSKAGRVITPHQVRGVVYGYYKKNSELIWAAVDRVLRVPPAYEEAVRKISDSISSTASVLGQKRAQ